MSGAEKIIVNKTISNIKRLPRNSDLDNGYAKDAVAIRLNIVPKTVIKIVTPNDFKILTSWKT